MGGSTQTNYEPRIRNLLQMKPVFFLLNLASVFWETERQFFRNKLVFQNMR